MANGKILRQNAECENKVYFADILNVRLLDVTISVAIGVSITLYALDHIYHSRTGNIF